MSGAADNIGIFSYIRKWLVSRADWLHTNYCFPPWISLPSMREKDLKLGIQHGSPGTASYRLLRREMRVISGFVNKTKEFQLTPVIK